MATLNDIDTIAVVMMENRSFDNVLGHLSHPDFGRRSDIQGLVDPATTTLYDNFYENRIYKPFPVEDKPFLHDLPHNRATIAEQIDRINGQATMGGFVASYAKKTHSAVSFPPPLGFLRPEGVPVTGFLASEYLTCNQYFSSLPAGTQANRAMAFAGESLIENNVTGLIPHRGLVFDWLKQHDVSWRVYHSGLSFFLLFGETEVLGSNFRSVRRLAQDFQQEPTDRAPQVIFIEPEYEDSPVHLGYTPNDNHPPLPMAPGEVFLHGIYTAMASNPARWAKTLLVVTYDEHGGFYDHVEPPNVRFEPPPGAKFTEPFETTGVRVPTLVASPCVEREGTSDALFDHT